MTWKAVLREPVYTLGPRDRVPVWQPFLIDSGRRSDGSFRGKITEHFSSLSRICRRIGLSLLADFGGCVFYVSTRYRGYLGRWQTKLLIIFLIVDSGHRLNFLAVMGFCWGYSAYLVNKKSFSSTLVLRRFKAVDQVSNRYVIARHEGHRRLESAS